MGKKIKFQLFFGNDVLPADYLYIYDMHTLTSSLCISVV